MSRYPRIVTVDLQEAISGPGIRVAEYCPVINQWHLPLWSRGDLSARPPACQGAGRQVDSARRSCCGLREKTPVKFPAKGSREVEQCTQTRATAQKVKKVCLTPSCRYQRAGLPRPPR